MPFNKKNKRRGGFTLVEIMIVVAIIALLAAIAVPGFLRARKRSQASRIINDLRLIDSAVDQYAIETNKKSGASVDWADVQKYLKVGSSLYNSGQSALAILFKAIFDPAFDLVLEDGRIRILPHDQALEFWKSWWAEEERKK